MDIREPSSKSGAGHRLCIPLCPTREQQVHFSITQGCWRDLNVKRQAGQREKRRSAIEVMGGGGEGWERGREEGVGEGGKVCEERPHFRRRNIDLLEATRLLNDRGFQFLPEKDLQDQPVMETVMSVGLRLRALEFTREQLKTLSYLAVTGLLPGSFPRAMWLHAVLRSFSSQEVATGGCTLWTRGNATLPEPPISSPRCAECGSCWIRRPRPWISCSVGYFSEE